MKGKPGARGGPGPRRPAAVLKPRLRLVRDGSILLGPGKADLLDAVRESGSLRRAATALGMSYMRAWHLARTMNAAFQQPLLTLARGGAGHGGATLTPTGTKVLALYRAMEKQTLRAVRADEERMRRLLRK